MMVNGILFLRTGENKGTFHVIKKAWLPQTTTATIACSQTRHTHVQIIYCIFLIPKTIGTPSPHHHHTNIPSHLAELIETSSDMIDLEPGTGPVLSTTATPGDSPNAPSQQTLTSQHLGWKRKNLKRSKNHSATSDLKKINFQFMNQILKQTFWGVTID